MNRYLKMDVMADWIEAEWAPLYPDETLITVWISDACTHKLVLNKFDREKTLPGGYTFAGYEQIDCSVITKVNTYSHAGELMHGTGAYVYQFAAVDSSDITEVLVMSSYFTDQGNMVCLACAADDFLKTWSEFSNECQRIYGSLSPGPRVIVIGGRTISFKPTVDWDDIVLPEKLKADLMEDVQSFFTKGVEVYQRLKLKPFRKLLLAGVPGTGKTMLCSALAKWALDQKYLVIYVSSADHAGSTFGKIQQAIMVASRSKYPTLILLEELDAYLHEREKALVLNVLDGSEGTDNDRGTLLIATTNYPEAIDERVLKRPGRLDRIFIIPETVNTDHAEQMLRQYLGEMWQDDHSTVARQLVGYPGAFIREVAVYALTQVAYSDLDDLSVTMLQNSFERLQEQIDAKDEFLAQKQKK
jgi:hypothetical protein